MARVVVDHLHPQPSLLEESCDAVGATEGSGKEEQSRWLVMTGVKGGRRDTRIGSWRGRFPKKGVLVKIHFGREHDSRHT
eukprot:1798103-Pleurochrysis_carterae.AAC.1